jgi:predicted ATPase/class 3 adenylate cyclase
VTRQTDQMVALPSGTVTLLFTDIEGSTRLWESQPEAMQAALVRHDLLVRSAVEAAGGYVFKTVGDAFCVAFPTAISALDGAVGAQHALAGERWPERTAIKARMALHSGVCSERDGDYFGPTVNRVARLEAIAHGGQLLLSGAAVALLGDDRPDGVTLRDMGEHSLKDLAAGERVFQAVISGLPDTFPPLRSLGNIEFQHNLPRYATSFVGRETELREVQELIEGGRLLTLVGTGGSGKTRLAVQAAAELLDGAGDGVWLVELASVSEPAQVATKIASMVGIGLVEGRTVEDTLLDALESRGLLLVLDNCEHVIDAVAQWADAVLSRCPRVALLATSREPLGVAGEQVFRLPPLPSPAADVDFETIAASEAVGLFVERAHAQRRDFDLTPENAGAVAAVCRRLDGLPLAIELAAATVRMFTVAEIASRLDERFLLLSGGGRRSGSTRHQTLRSVIDWSYDLLDEPQRRAFARLGVFTGGWTLEAAEAVCANPADASVSTTALMLALVDKSLVETIPLDGASRYDMLETIRAYASEVLSAGGDEEVDAARRAHLRYYVDLAERAAPHLTQKEAVEWFDRLDADSANLHAALAFGARRDVEAGLRLAVALDGHWRRRGETPTIVDHVRTLVDAAPNATSRLLPDCLATVARLEWMVGNLDAALARIEQAIALSRSSEDQARLARVIGEKAWVRFLQGDDGEATACSDAALEIAKALSDDELVAHCEVLVGTVQARTGDKATCVRHLESGLAMYERIGDEMGGAFALINLSASELELPNPDLARATAYSRRALEIFERHKEPHAASGALDNLAWALALEGRRDEALGLFCEVLWRGRRDGNLTLVALTLSAIGPLRAEAAPAQTAELLGHADALLQRLGVAPSSRDLELHEATVRRCRAVLGDDEYRAQYERGSRLPTPEVVDATLRLRDAHV